MLLADPQLYAKKVIAAHGGPDKLIAVMDRDINEFNSLWLQDAEQIGRVLKAHLTVEYFLTRYIEFKNTMLPSLVDARITFSQKIDLLHPSDRLVFMLKPGLRRLNQIRNRLAHSLKVEVREDDAEVFLRVGIFSSMRTELNKGSNEALPGSPIEIFEEFAKFAAGLFQSGSRAESHIWEDIMKEAINK